MIYKKGARRLSENQKVGIAQRASCTHVISGLSGLLLDISCRLGNLTCGIGEQAGGKREELVDDESEFLDEASDVNGVR